MKYIPRTNAPSSTDKFYNSKENIYYAAGVGMPNCTAYAWGRLYEITSKKPTIGLVNACDWFKEAKRLGYTVGSQPKLGAVICWDGAGKNPYGHIGVVEEILADGSVRVSESAWGGIYWNNGLIASPKNHYQHPTSENHYPCLGFIYCGIDFDGNEISKEERLVRRMYIEALFREVDDSGLTTYTNVVKNGWTEDRLKQDLLNSVEYKTDKYHWQKYWFVVMCYKVILGRFPENESVIKNRLGYTNQQIFDTIWDSPEAKNRRKV